MAMVHRERGKGWGLVIAAHTADLIAVVFLCAGYTEVLEFAADDHPEAFEADGLLGPGYTRMVVCEGVSLHLQSADLAGSEEAVAAGHMDVDDGGVDDAGF